MAKDVIPLPVIEADWLGNSVQVLPKVAMAWQLMLVVNATHESRLAGEQQISTHFFRRSDGTTCYFFSVEDLVARAEAAGFRTMQCSYACTKLRNRKRQLDMKRVFVHGVFQKPL